MLHLNKRSCIVTNLIGIQWFYKGVDRITPRDGTGDNEGLNRRYKRKWNAAMNESANWKTLFFLFSPSFAVEILILSRGLVPFTRVNAALVGASSETCFPCVCYADADILLDVKNSFLSFFFCKLGALPRKLS